MSKVKVVFLHHFKNEVVVNNLESFRRHGNDVVPMRDFDSPGLEGSWVCPSSEKLLVPRGPGPRMHWGDVPFLNYALMEGLDSDYYLYCEWDTYCACNLEEFLEPYLKYDMVVSRFFRHAENLGWYWFGGMDLRRFPDLSGCFPTAGILFRKDALLKMCGWVRANKEIMRVNSECRLSTACCSLGLKVGTYEEKVSRHISHVRIDITEPGIIYHPVKFMFDDSEHFKGRKK